MRFAALAEQVLSRKRPQLKWRWLDPLEFALIVLCGLLLVGFLISELGDVTFRILRRPWLDAQEFSLGFFAWGVFMGGALGVRRNDHFRLSATAEVFSGRTRTAIEVFQQLVMLFVALCMVWFGYVNFLNGFGSYLMPSLTPIAILYAAIPVCGALIALFTVEKLVNGLTNGFPDTAPDLGMAELIMDVAPNLASPLRGESLPRTRSGAAAQRAAGEGLASP